MVGRVVDIEAIDMKKIAAVFLCVGFTAVSALANQKTFATPQEAVNALRKASQSNSTSALLNILGPDSRDIVVSGDPSDDKDARKNFVQLLAQKQQLLSDPASPDKQILSIGEDDWPFPIPLVKTDGRWHFDTAQGKNEILARRIGSNELNAIEICRGYVEAQLEYAQTHRHKEVPVYAQKIISSSGTEDGLYWDAGPGRSECMIPKGFARAVLGMSESDGEPYHGYYFRILTAQGPSAQGGAMNYIIDGKMIGGFALIAWPAEYGVSGIDTFIVDHTGVVYEKHLGPDTPQVAKTISVFDPDSSWQSLKPE